MNQDTIFDLINQEKKRQQEVIELIPSENYASPEVLEAVGSVLMNKYAEGDPGRRYYQGNQVVDQVESLCEQRVLETFGLDDSEWGANVQPHSGCEANLIVYNALLTPGDTIMSMYLPDGGHLSHGWHQGDTKLTLVSKLFDVVFYKVDTKTRLFDYDQIQEQAEMVQPRMIISGGTAYPREIDHQRMAKIAHSVGAYYLADVSHEAGLIAAGVHVSPFQDADIVTFTTHKTLRGPRGAVIVARRAFRLPTNHQETEDLLPLIDRSVIPGVQGGPHLHSIAGIAVALKQAQSKQFEEYASQVVKNAQLCAKLFSQAEFDVVSGGTDKHLVLLDLRSKKISAWVAAWALEYANIVVNRNTVPNETESAFYPSGIRLGTPAITTRGMKEAEIEQITQWMIEVIEYSKKWEMPKEKKARQRFLKQVKQELSQDKTLHQIKQQVVAFSKRFPLFR